MLLIVSASAAISPLARVTAFASDRRSRTPATPCDTALVGQIGQFTSRSVFQVPATPRTTVVTSFPSSTSRATRSLPTRTIELVHHRVDRILSSRSALTSTVIFFKDLPPRGRDAECFGLCGQLLHEITIRSGLSRFRNPSTRADAKRSIDPIRRARVSLPTRTSHWSTIVLMRVLIPEFLPRHDRDLFREVPLDAVVTSQCWHLTGKITKPSIH